MDMPKGVKQAVIATWASLVIFALVAVVEKRTGILTYGAFGAYLIGYGIFCIFPYKLSKGSNVTRYVYTILSVIGYLMMLGGTEGMKKLDVIFSILLLPLNIFIIWRLFTGEANDWFTNKRPPALPKTPL